MRSLVNSRPTSKYSQRENMAITLTTVGMCTTFVNVLTPPGPDRLRTTGFKFINGQCKLVPIKLDVVL